MKKFKIFILSLASSFAAFGADLDVSSGQLEGLLADEAIKKESSLRLRGTIDARDLAALENLPASVKSLDLSEVRIASLTMPTRKIFGRTLFAEGEIPAYTFFKAPVEQLILPADVSAIGEGAFAGSSIAEITIPEGVTQLGDYAFYGCPNLKRVTLPRSLKAMGKGAFGNCTALESADLSATAVTAIPEKAFAGAVALSAVNLPAGLETIGREAFSHTAVKTLDLSGVRSFEAYALSSMPFLTSLSINPDAEIGDGLLMDDISLASLTGLPEFVPDYFAANCAGLDASAAAEASTLGRYSFANTSAPQEMILAGFIEKIDRGAFSGLTNLAKIDATALEDRVPLVDEFSFEGLPQQQIELWVSDESFSLWDGHPVWGLFRVMSANQTGVDTIAPDADSSIGIFCRGGLLIVESPERISDVRVYTTDGRMAYVASPDSERVEIDAASLPSGVLVVAASDAAGNARTISLIMK